MKMRGWPCSSAPAYHNTKGVGVYKPHPNQPTPLRFCMMHVSLAHIAACLPIYSTRYFSSLNIWIKDMLYNLPNTSTLLHLIASRFPDIPFNSHCVVVIVSLLRLLLGNIFMIQMWIFSSWYKCEFLVQC